MWCMRNCAGGMQWSHALTRAIEMGHGAVVSKHAFGLNHISNAKFRSFLMRDRKDRVCRLSWSNSMPGGISSVNSQFDQSAWQVLLVSYPPEDTHVRFSATATWQLLLVVYAILLAPFHWPHKVALRFIPTGNMASHGELQKGAALGNFRMHQKYRKVCQNRIFSGEANTAGLRLAMLGDHCAVKIECAPSATA